MEFLKKNFLFIVIGILVVILLLQRCSGNNSNKTTVTIKTDTLIVQKTVIDTFYTKPVFVKGKTVTNTEIEHDTIYAPSQDCDTLKKQYFSVTSKYLSENIFRDSIPVQDSIVKGYINVTDTISKNMIVGKRKVELHLTYPEKTITNNITKTLPSKTQVYLGFGLLGNKQNPVGGADVNLMLKTKSDKVYDISAKYYNGEIIYGAGMKWKIKF